MPDTVPTPTPTDAADKAAMTIINLLAPTFNGRVPCREQVEAVKATIAAALERYEQDAARREERIETLTAELDRATADVANHDQTIREQIDRRVAAEDVARRYGDQCREQAEQIDNLTRERDGYKQLFGEYAECAQRLVMVVMYEPCRPVSHSWPGRKHVECLTEGVQHLLADLDQLRQRVKHARNELLRIGHGASASLSADGDDERTIDHEHLKLADWVMSECMSAAEVINTDSAQVGMKSVDAISDDIERRGRENRALAAEPVKD